jgi:hypothetical protein
MSRRRTTTDEATETAVETKDVEGHSRVIRATEADDVEGHRRNNRATEAEDVEGHRRNNRATEAEDVEGHRRNNRATEAADVEGHSFLTDPHLARQISRDRSSELERAARERARQKEARPNKQHQD